MAAVVIFYSALMATFFFILSIIFNAIESITKAFEEIIAVILGIIILIAILFLAFNLIISVVAHWGNFWKFIGWMVVSIIVLMLIIGVGGGLFGIVASIIIFIVTWLHDGSEIIAKGCQNYFNHFVKIVKNRIDMS